jgi:DNA-binding response OmpR family regulator
MGRDSPPPVLNVSSERKALFGRWARTPVSEVRPTVLVVEDERAVAEAFTNHLSDEYAVRTVYSGEAALAAADATVDAVVLDRRLPDRHGDEVLATLRERGFEGPVVMTTAVDPDLNILEMDFDDYLVKPVEGSTLRETIGRHLAAADRGPRLAEFVALAAKLSVIEEGRPDRELEDSEEYQRLRRRAGALADALEGEVDDLADAVAVHRALDEDED